MHRDDWLYYASFSPIWLKRIEQYAGVVNHVEKTVDFGSKYCPIDEADEMMERFYEQYGYDLDEQSMNLLSMVAHTNENNTKQMSLDEFCIKYGGTMGTMGTVQSNEPELLINNANSVDNALYTERIEHTDHAAHAVPALHCSAASMDMNDTIKKPMLTKKRFIIIKNTQPISCELFR